MSKKCLLVVLALFAIALYGQEADVAAFVQLRHTSYVWSVAFSPDGKCIAFCPEDGTVILWDTESGREIRTLSGHTDSVESVAFSPDGKYIVSGSGDDTVKLWDAESGRELHTLLGHTGSVESVAFSPAGTRVLSGSSDGTTRLWNAESGAEIVSLVGFSSADSGLAAAARGVLIPSAEQNASSIDSEWIAVTPDGYYAASPRGDRYLNVRVGNKVTGMDSFRSVFDNPDVVKARLAGEPDPPSKKNLSIRDVASFFPPTLRLYAPAEANETGTADIAITAADDNQPLQTIKVAVNGRILGREELSAIRGAPGLSPQKASLSVTGDQKTLTFTLPLSLEPGENLVEVIAFNGYAESRQKTSVAWDAPAGTLPAPPALWILAVGVNEYEASNIENLNYCAADARGIIDSFKEQEGRRYSKVNSLLVADGGKVTPTGKDIRESLGFLSQAGPLDVILLFLAGHGVTGKDGMFYFLPRDARKEKDGTVIGESAISGDEIASVLDSPGNRLIFIDACHSGGVDNDRMTRMLMDTNAFVFTASKGNEYSEEKAELGHGVFTWSVMGGLRNAKRSLGMLQLSGEVREEVPRMTENRQHPSSYSLGFYDFILSE